MHNLYSFAKIFKQTAQRFLTQDFLKKIAISIRPTDRINVSHMKFDMGKFILSSDENASINNNKPSGFYYAFGRQWLDFFSFSSGDVYILNLNESRVFKLTADNLEEFTKKYCEEYSLEKKMNDRYLYGIGYNKPIGTNVNWSKFKKDYDGIEIPNLREIKEKIKLINAKNVKLQPEEKKFSYHMRFIDAFDVDGGCFWNPKTLVNATKIATIEEKEDSIIEDERPQTSTKPLNVLRRYKFNPDTEIAVKDEDGSIIPPKVNESSYWAAMNNISSRIDSDKSKEAIIAQKIINFFKKEKNQLYSIIQSLYDNPSAAGVDDYKENIKRKRIEYVAFSPEDFYDFKIGEPLNIQDNLIEDYITLYLMCSDTGSRRAFNHILTEVAYDNKCNSLKDIKESITSLFKTYRAKFILQDDLNQIASFINYELYWKAKRSKY